MHVCRSDRRKESKSRKERQHQPPRMPPSTGLKWHKNGHRCIGPPNNSPVKYMCLHLVSRLTSHFLTGQKTPKLFLCLCGFPRNQICVPHFVGTVSFLFPRKTKHRALGTPCFRGLCGSTLSRVAFEEGFSKLGYFLLSSFFLAGGWGGFPFCVFLGADLGP